MLQHSGVIDSSIDPEDYLNMQDIDGDTMDVDLNDINEE